MENYPICFSWDCCRIWRTNQNTCFWNCINFVCTVVSKKRSRWTHIWDIWNSAHVWMIGVHVHKESNDFQICEFSQIVCEKLSNLFLLRLFSHLKNKPTHLFLKLYQLCVHGCLKKSVPGEHASEIFKMRRRYIVQIMKKTVSVIRFTYIRKLWFLHIPGFKKKVCEQLSNLFILKVLCHLKNQPKHLFF